MVPTSGAMVSLGDLLQRKSGAFGGDYMHLAWKYSEAHVHLYEICNDIHIYTKLIIYIYIYTIIMVIRDTLNVGVFCGFF